MENVTICKGFSAEVLASFPDNYFDWVYIDGNHLYEFVKKDVELSFQKVKPGGVIAGDDSAAGLPQLAVIDSSANGLPTFAESSGRSSVGSVSLDSEVICSRVPMDD